MMKKKRQADATTEIEITSQMMRAGELAFSLCGEFDGENFHYPSSSEVVREIYIAMRKAAISRRYG